jgi:Ribosome-associated protein Y (PSrp-1)
VHAQVVFKREKFREICEVILTGDGERIVVKEETDDIYSSIDFAYESLEKQVKKLKEKKKEIRPPRGVTEARPVPSAGYTVQEVEVSPLSTEEAFEIFRKGKDTVFLFYNTDYDKVCCLYRAGDKEIMLVPVLS